TIYVYNKDDVLNEISVVLQFLSLLELLESMINFKYFQLKNENQEIVMNLFYILEECNRKTEKCYSIEFNFNFKEEIEKMIKEKIEDFTNNYIYGKLKIYVKHLKKN
uniref:Uncharacterized protein n=1 Tax=Meloidogyne hapla TaxID=6305 RepID=A0A1I8BJ24_MELHA